MQIQNCDYIPHRDSCSGHDEPLGKGDAALGAANCDHLGLKRVAQPLGYNHRSNPTKAQGMKIVEELSSNVKIMRLTATAGRWYKATRDAILWSGLRARSVPDAQGGADGCRCFFAADEAMGERINGQSYLTATEAARRLLVCDETIRRWVRLGKLPVRKLGFQYFILEKDVDGLPKAREKSA